MASFASLSFNCRGWRPRLSAYFYCALTQQGYPKFLNFSLLEFRDVLINLFGSSGRPTPTMKYNGTVPLCLVKFCTFSAKLNNFAMRNS